MKTSFPKLLEFNGMSATTAFVVWTMIAFLVIILLILGFSFFKNFYSVIDAKQSKSKKIDNKGFGDFSG